jgi:hypothetical protein
MAMPSTAASRAGGAAALLIVAGAAAFVVATGKGRLARSLDGPDGEEIAELVLGARAAARFGLAYPTTAVGWREPALAHPVLSRPPGVDLAVRAAFAAAGEHAAAARAVALAATVLALLAIARLGWLGWGPWGAAAGAALFALSPYAGAFGDRPHGAMPALAAAAMALGSLLDLRRTRSRLTAATALVWTLAAGFCDWSAYLVIVPLALVALAGGVLPGRLRRARPQAVDLPDGLSGPLASILARREGQTAASLTTALAIAVAAEVLFFVAWMFKLGALGELFSTLAGAGAAPSVALAPPPAALARALVGVAGPAIVAAWLVTVVARIARGQADARSVPAAALLAAGVLFPILCGGLARRAFLLPGLAAGGVVLAAVDLAAVLGVLAGARRLTATPAPPGAIAVSLAIAAALAAVAVPGWRRAHAETARPPVDGGGAAADLSALARAVTDTTEPGDRLLLLRGFPTDLRFFVRVDRDVEIVDSLAGLPSRRPRAGREVALALEPLPGGEDARLGALLREHPALRIGGAWLVDLGRFEPGVRSYEAGDGGALVERPRDELALDLAHGVAPARDRLPDVGDDPTLPRPLLFAYYNMLGAAGGQGDGTDALARVRARLLDGFATSPRVMDPAPLGFPGGVRWTARDRQLDVVWTCPGAAAAPLPDGAGVGGARFVFHPADRAWAPSAFERPLARPCPPGAPAGELHEQSFTFKLPFRGRFHVGIQLLGASKPRRPLNPAPVELGVIVNG